jgi:hypothetical protein
MWILLRSDAHKEHYVARQVSLLGFSAWVPCQIIACRPQVSRRITAKAHLSKLRELPILPRRLFAEVPAWLQTELEGIRHLDGIERDAASMPLQIPPSQIASFRAEIDRENTAALALAQKASRRQKAKWRDMKDALLDLISTAKETLEEAA